MYEIKYTTGAIDDLKTLKKYEQQLILDGVDEQLVHEPKVETRNRKQLRPNKVAEYELRVQKYRVFYDVDGKGKIVKIVAIGHKDGNKLLIRGKEFAL